MRCPHRCQPVGPLLFWICWPKWEEVTLDKDQNSFKGWARIEISLHTVLSACLHSVRTGLPNVPPLVSSMHSYLKCGSKAWAYQWKMPWCCWPNREHCSSSSSTWTSCFWFCCKDKHLRKCEPDQHILVKPMLCARQYRPYKEMYLWVTPKYWERGGKIIGEEEK